MELLRTITIGLVTAITLWVTSSMPQAQISYPNRPVAIAVGAPPGGVLDHVARNLAQALWNSLDQPFIVENQPGAGGQLAIRSVGQSPPDGYRLLLSTIPNPAVEQAFGLDFRKELVPIALVSRIQDVLVVNASEQFKDVQQFISAGRSSSARRPIFGASGLGTPSHLSYVLLRAMAGVDLELVQHRDMQGAYSDLLANRVQAMFAPLLSNSPAVLETQSGRLRMLASTGSKRSALVPDLPTMVQAGVTDFESGAWHGFFAPRSTPPDIVARLNKAINTALQNQAVASRLQQVGVEPIGGTSEQFGCYLDRELTRWKQSGSELRVDMNAQQPFMCLRRAGNPTSSSGAAGVFIGDSLPRASSAPGQAVRMVQLNDRTRIQVFDNHLDLSLAVPSRMSSDLAKILGHRGSSGTLLLEQQRTEQILASLCDGRGSPCSNNKPVEPLNAAGAAELHRRLQYEVMAKVLTLAEVQSFTGLKESPTLWADLGTAKWNSLPDSMRQRQTTLDRELPLARADRLIDFKVAAVKSARNPTIEQTNPGDGADGAPSLPISLRASPPLGAVPTLPVPRVEPGNSGTSASCGNLTDTATVALLSSDDFARLRRMSPQAGSAATRYCRDGFTDVVLLDTAEPGAPGIRRVCSGVRVGGRWVLTAKHCTEHWTATSGRIFQLTEGAAGCLDRNNDTVRHPGDLGCSLQLVGRTGEVLKAPGRDLALIGVTDATTSLGFVPRTSTVRSIDLAHPLEVTLAGYGETPDRKLGRLRVGWSQILDARALRAMATGIDRTTNDAIDFVPVVFSQDDSVRNRLVSWGCRGDSGAPIFGGRVFGWMDEEHYVAAIVSESSVVDRCAPDPPLPDVDLMKVISLLEPVARVWLCDSTKQALPICQR